MPTSRRYRIESLSLERCPPIGDLRLDFIEGVNLIVRGDDYAPIAEAIRTLSWPDAGAVHIRDSGNRDVLTANWTNCFIDWMSIPNGEEFRASCRLDDHWTSLSIDNPAMLKRVSELLSESIAYKLGVGITKFAAIPDCGPETFVVEVGRRGSVSVRAGRALLDAPHEVPPWYSNVGDLFVAAGELALIHLCGVVAAREYLGLDCPLILDSTFLGTLDYSHQIATFERSHSLGQQVIVLLERRDFRRMSDYCRLGDNIVHLTRSSIGAQTRGESNDGR